MSIHGSRTNEVVIDAIAEVSEVVYLIDFNLQNKSARHMTCEIAEKTAILFQSVVIVLYCALEYSVEGLKSMF